ncbi:MAG: hypothetical protein LBU42_04135 [Prevotellaceae bacterium]|jgi:hypothetical protein|nr:hypothetical protein [Prevotellaceae bacterium]
MKKIFFLLTMLASVAASAQVTYVEPVSATYTSQTVSFRVWWNAGSRDATHLSKVWVWVDYITVNSDNTTSGNSWTRAAVSAASPAASVTYDGSNRQGFWLQGASGSYSATVTVKLNITASKFNWCAYVSDYPPNAKITTGTYNNGTYTLKGTQPFTINGSITVNANTYSGSITSITDATQCSGYRCSLRDEAVGAIGCCAGLITLGSYCRDLAADAASTFSCSGVVIEVKNAPIGGSTWATANSACTNIGWRLPTFEEVLCMINQGKITFATGCGGWKSHDWWTNNGPGCRTDAYKTLQCEHCAGCGSCGNGYASGLCVRN